MSNCEETCRNYPTGEHAPHCGGNLSLEVAKIMYPEYEWITNEDGDVSRRVHGAGIVANRSFDHTTPEALGQMCLFFSNIPIANGLMSILNSTDNPNEALARAIIATQEGV